MIGKPIGTYCNSMGLLNFLRDNNKSKKMFSISPGALRSCCYFVYIHRVNKRSHFPTYAVVYYNIVIDHLCNRVVKESHQSESVFQFLIHNTNVMHIRERAWCIYWVYINVFVAVWTNLLTARRINISNTRTNMTQCLFINENVLIKIT